MKKYFFIVGLALFWACNSQHKKTTEEEQEPLSEIMNQSLEKAVKQYKLMDKTVADTLLPRSTNPDGSLMTNKPWWWTSGFYPGSLWYLYEFSGDSTIKKLADKRTESIVDEQYNTYDHDIGFKMMCSYGNELRITGDSSECVPVLLTAAETLTKRYDDNVGLIRSWGDIDDQKDYLVIVDNMMNLELLFWATKESGDSTYYNIAVSHADSTMKNHYRDDGSSWHVVNYDPETGAVKNKRTEQGFADSSSWARGQAWGLYGFTMSYRMSGLERYLDHAKKIADFIVNHPNLPEDKVPYWDFNAPNIPDALRDASAGAIIASALVELSEYVDGEERESYLSTGRQIVRSLSSDKYRADIGKNNNFLLMHSVGHIPQDSEVDVPLSYADYYYIETIMRLRNK